MAENTPIILIIILALVNLSMIIRLGFLNRRIKTLETHKE